MTDGIGTLRRASPKGELPYAASTAGYEVKQVPGLRLVYVDERGRSVTFQIEPGMHFWFFSLPANTWDKDRTPMTDHEVRLVVTRVRAALSFLHISFCLEVGADKWYGPAYSVDT